jgi:aminoglycoside phosphotransferase (APT) family kinase protein
MTDVATSPTDGVIREAVARVLFGAGLAPLREIDRRPSEYRTSFPLEELDLTLEDGIELRLAFKRLGWSSLGEARLAKPQFLHDPQREPAVYEAVLPQATPGPPRFYGSVVDPEADRYWLFVEWVEGRELYQVGDLELWRAAARWLGELHAGLGGGDLERQAERGRLLDYDRAYYGRWIERAREFAAATPREGSDLPALDWLAQRYDAVVEGLLALPRTVIHGEFYASNVLVAGDAETVRVAPVDWELAAVAPGAIDLAALVSGNWREEDREEIAAAYRSVAGPAQLSPRDLDLARLHLAVQWLGWAPRDWVPPEGQRHDWLAEALELAGRLAL